jgi:hypothetical protein
MPWLVFVDRQPELAKVPEVSDTTNALGSSPANMPVTDLDIEEQRAHPNAQLVGQAETAPGFLRVHRQHNVELRVQPQCQALEERDGRLGLIHSRGHTTRGGYSGEDGNERATRAARAPAVHG